MRKGTITKSQAKKILLVKDGMVHTFYNPNGMLIGGEHSIESILKDIKNAKELCLTGKSGKSMGHGLAILPESKLQKDVLFVETNMDEVKKLEEAIK